jgi:hypothetical protein
MAEPLRQHAGYSAIMKCLRLPEAAASGGYRN